MSDATTVRLLEAYRQQSGAPRFLSGYFQSPARNFHNSEEVELDILREDEEIAVAIHDITTGPRMNESTEYTSKRFKPPIFKEAGPVSSYSLMKRHAGIDPFTDPDYQANAMVASMDLVRKLEDKVRRSVELMASQVLQTGTVTVSDENGNPLVEIDFKAKPAHFADASGTWANGAGDPLGDLEARADLIRDNSRAEAVRAIMGRDAIRAFLANDEVRALLDNRRINIGEVGQPQARGNGGKYHGVISVGQNVLEIWSYTGRYKDPATGNLVRYVGDDKVIVMSDERLDLTWGNVPYIGSPDQRALPFMPSRVSNGQAGLDLIMNSWLSPDRTSLMVSVSARPLTIPTAIDSFGCMDVIL